MVITGYTKPHLSSVGGTRSDPDGLKIGYTRQAALLKLS